MDYIKKLYCKEKYINLDILEDNIIAKKFFEKNGFVYISDFNVGGKKFLAYTSAGQTLQES